MTVQPAAASPSKSTTRGVEASNATSRAFERLKHDIMHAVLQPREQLLEGELAERLGMSRTPVREACIRLESEGLVEIIPRRGIRIVGISPQDMAELYDLLGTLEGRAAELAATRSTPAESDALDLAVDRMQAALDDDDLDAWAEADSDFHRKLVHASGNRHLARTTAQYADLVHRARLVTLRLRPRPDKSVADHRELAQLIRSGNAEAARELHVEHRRAAAATITTLLHSLSLSDL